MISQNEYKKRRETLASSLKKNSISLLLSATPKTRSNDTEYLYRQNSNFYYLTGFKEDGSAMMLVKTAKKVKSFLFVAKKDEALELWTGKRVGVKKAKELFDFDDVYEFEELEKIFKKNIENKSSFYYDFSHENSQIETFKKLTKNFHTHRNIAKKIAKKRLIKSEAEIALIKNAVSISKEAHHQSMKSAPNLRNEYELLSEIEYVFKKNGAYSDAYTSIVASGNAANTLHYISNDKPIQRAELILIDAGCEYEYYASDITRTIPANGKFSEAQKEIYELVLKVEKEIISMIKPGVLRSELHSRSEELLCKGMVKLGILKGKVKKILKKKKHKKYYPHGIGHWMGIDVHDEAAYKTKKGKEIPLKAGMVMTIEPGLYLDKEDTKIPKKYRGIGIRIEDDILVSEEGCENLSTEIIKEVTEIEELSTKR
jgi:Xaa-Pro aminopeptidase